MSSTETPLPKALSGMLGAKWRPMQQGQILGDANKGQGQRPRETLLFINTLALQGTVPVLISNQSGTPADL